MLLDYSVTYVPGCSGAEMQVMHLDDQSAEPVGSALRVSLAAGEVCNLSAREGHVWTAGGGNPAASLQADEELAETGDVRADFATGSNVHDVDVSIAGSGS